MERSHGCFEWKLQLNWRNSMRLSKKLGKSFLKLNWNQKHNQQLNWCSDFFMLFYFLYSVWWIYLSTDFLQQIIVLKVMQGSAYILIKPLEKFFHSCNILNIIFIFSNKYHLSILIIFWSSGGEVWNFFSRAFSFLNVFIRREVGRSSC